MKYHWMILALVVNFGVARADSPFLESPRLISSALAQGRTVQGFGGDGRTRFQALAVPYRIEGDECVSIGLIRIASNSVENWRLCHGELERLPGFSPKLTPTNNPQVAETVGQAQRRAIQSGRAMTMHGEYRILARRVEDSEPSGCHKVESIILLDGLLLSRDVAGVCADQVAGTDSQVQK